MDRDLLNQYAAGPDKLRQAVDGVSEKALRSFPIPGSWSLQQLVLHLQDSDLIIAERMKRIIAEEKPVLLAFNHDGFVQNLEPDAQSVADALTLIELQRRQMSAVLRKLPDAKFERVGIHSERGPMTLTDVVRFA